MNEHDYSCFTILFFSFFQLIIAGQLQDSLIHDSSIYIIYLTIMTFLNKLKFSLEMRCILFVFSSSSQLCLLVMKLHSLNSEIIIKKNCLCLTMTSARRPKKSIKTRTWILYIYFNFDLINRSTVRLMVYFGLK